MPDRRGVLGVLAFVALLKLAALTGPWRSSLWPEEGAAPLLWSGLIFFVVWAWLRGIADVGRALTRLARPER